MILKGNQRGGGQQLAAHLMNSFDNERVEVADVRGAVARDLSGALSEWRAHSRATNCKKYLYSLSINPDQRQGALSREQYLDLIGRTERSLRLVGQPRAVVFHVKDGREHCHVVWSRIEIGAEKIRSVQITHDRLKLRTVVREFARENGLQLPPGMSADKEKHDAVRAAARRERLDEKQQQERTGVSKATRTAEIGACWTSTADGPGFVRALESKNYYLARGDKRDYVVLDLYGEVHSLSRQLTGIVRSKAVRERLKDFPVDRLRDVKTTKQLVDERRAEREDRDPARTKTREAAQRAAELRARQQQRREVLARMRTDLLARHAAERAELGSMQVGENKAVASKRKPSRFTAFLFRMTGIGGVVAWAQSYADRKRGARHAEQTEALGRRHMRELKALDRHDRALDRLDRREDRSAALALKREDCRRLRTVRLKTEFEKADRTEERVTADGEVRGLSEQFRQRAKDADFRKGDLRSTFERTGGTDPITRGDQQGTRKKTPERPKVRHDRERDDF